MATKSSSWQDPVPPASGLGYMRALAAMASQLGWTIPAGLAGSYDLLTGKGVEEADKSIRDLMGNAYSPTDSDSQAAMQDIASFPLFQMFSKAAEKAGDVGYDIAGPTGGMLGQLAPDALDMLFGSHGAGPISQAMIMTAKTVPTPRGEASQITTIFPDYQRNPRGTPDLHANSYLALGDEKLDLYDYKNKLFEPMSTRQLLQPNSSWPVLGSEVLKDMTGQEVLGTVKMQADGPSNSMFGTTYGGLMHPDLQGIGLGNEMYSNIWDDLHSLGFATASDSFENVSDAAKRVYESSRMNKKYDIQPGGARPGSDNPQYIATGPGNPNIARFLDKTGYTGEEAIRYPNTFFFDERVDPNSYWPTDKVTLEKMARESRASDRMPLDQFLTLMDPYEFLRMTLDSTKDIGSIALDGLFNPRTQKRETRLNAFDVYTQANPRETFPYLLIGPDTGKILGHQGRHRASVWARQGHEKLPVQLRLAPFVGANGPTAILPNVLKGQFDGSRTLPLSQIHGKMWPLLPKDAYLQSINRALGNQYGRSEHPY